MREEKKIFFFAISLLRGGAENQLVKLAQFLSEKGFKIKIIYGLPQNDFTNKLTAAGISAHFFNYRSFSGLISLLKFVAKEKPDLMITFMYAANLIGRMLKILYKIPLVTSVRNNEISKSYSRLYKISYKIDSISTFNSQYALEKFVKKRITVPKKSILVNNAIVLPNEHINQKDNLCFNLISVAHFRPQKDYKTLFDAIKILKNNKIIVHLNVIGHTFDSKWPHEEIIKSGIEDEVSIKGFVQNTDDYLASADALVLSTLWEGTPNAILEGMAHKLPIISSKVPGCEGLVLDGECGFLFEKQNPEQLADKIIAMMELSKEERGLLGENGYRYVYENYREEVVYQKWMTLIEKAIKQTA